jgi:hypothetical protein
MTRSFLARVILIGVFIISGAAVSAPGPVLSLDSTFDSTAGIKSTPTDSATLVPPNDLDAPSVAPVAASADPRPIPDLTPLVGAGDRSVPINDRVGATPAKTVVDSALVRAQRCSRRFDLGARWCDRASRSGVHQPGATRRVLLAPP